ncbi:hypothetical protein ACO2Q8_12745 [Larkinella sp. VNQ87]|uniref:hypothetical protein n=1 Tax=Larkinella sp. VNQ87 TaxID=3400921 RepID=UPI003BFCD9F1
MKMFFFVLLAGALSHPVAAQTKPAPSRTLQFCTSVGPVDLTLKGDSVTGRYLLTVTPDRKRGIIRGTLHQGLLTGTWDDPDGIGRIIFGFNPGMTKFIAIYNTARDSSQWYNEWKGILKAEVYSLPEAQRRTFSCEWD